MCQKCWSWLRRHRWILTFSLVLSGCWQTFQLQININICWRSRLHFYSLYWLWAVKHYRLVYFHFFTKSVVQKDLKILLSSSHIMIIMYWEWTMCKVGSLERVEHYQLFVFQVQALKVLVNLSSNPDMMDDIVQAQVGKKNTLSLWVHPSFIQRTLIVCMFW